MYDNRPRRDTASRVFISHFIRRAAHCSIPAGRNRVRKRPVHSNQAIKPDATAAACQAGHLPTLRLVIELLGRHAQESTRIAQVSMANSFSGVFPFLLPCSGEISAVRILCQQCHVPIADMSRSCHRGRTPLLVAVRQGNVQMVKLLISGRKLSSSLVQ